MNNMVKFSEMEERIVTLRDVKVILDSDVAVLYGVEVKQINEVVKNNPEKFPEGYIFYLSDDEWFELKSKFSASINDKDVKLPDAFSEKGFYMLATMLKSGKTAQTATAMVETFIKIRELTRVLSELSNTKDGFKQESLMEKSSEILADLLGDDISINDIETGREFNCAIFNPSMRLNENINNEVEWSEKIESFPVITYFAGLCKN